MFIPTYTYHQAPPEPDSITVDEVTYERIERLPRNLRPGDVIILGDGTDRAGYHQAYVTVTEIHTRPESHSGWRRYAPECTVRFRLRPQYDTWRWRSFGYELKFYDKDTKERTSVYRARTPRTRTP
jgi:hypothetical protein